MSSKVESALISVSDKRDVETFARALTDLGVEVLSTGGTFAKLNAAGVPDVVHTRRGVGYLLEEHA